MRSVTMFVTVLPVSSHKYYCSPKMNTTSSVVVLKRAWQLLIGFGLSINGRHTYCGDYIYSGHTVILVMSYLIIAECELSYLSPMSCCLSVIGYKWNNDHSEYVEGL
jgi:shingomyelin synthase